LKESVDDEKRIVCQILKERKELKKREFFTELRPSIQNVKSNKQHQAYSFLYFPYSFTKNIPHAKAC